MKKILIYSTIIALAFITACENAAKKDEKTVEKTEEVKTVKEPAANANTETKKTSVSVGPGGADVKHKNTEVAVDKNGVKIGTKTVKN